MKFLDRWFYRMLFGQTMPVVETVPSYKSATSRTEIDHDSVIRGIVARQCLGRGNIFLAQGRYITEKQIAEMRQRTIESVL